MRGSSRQRVLLILVCSLVLAAVLAAGAGCDRRGSEGDGPGETISLPTPPPEPPFDAPDASEAAPLASFIVGETPADVLDARLDRVARELALRLRFDEPGGQVERVVRLGVLADDPAWRGARFSIHQGRALGFAVEACWNRDDPHHVRVTERTEVDALHLDLQERPADGVRVERVTWKDRTARFELRTSPAKLPDEETQALSRRFREVYPGGTTLDNNRDGDRLMQLLAEPDFATWLARAGGKLAGRTPSEIGGALAGLECGTCDPRVQRFCLVMSACAQIKCLVGAWANPICHACFGANAACVVASLLEWIVGERG
jgi:hypothetical protein